MRKSTKPPKHAAPKREKRAKSEPHAARKASRKGATAKRPPTVVGAAPASRFTIIAEKLINAIYAVLPLASKDKDHGDLMQLRFVAGKSLEISATDGIALGTVSAALEDEAKTPITFCVQTNYLRPLIAAVKRVSGEKRLTLDVVFTVDRHRIAAQIGDTLVGLPNVAEQLVFPDVARVVPVPPTTNKTAITSYGVSPSLLGRVMRAASIISTSVIMRAPEEATSAIRIDVSSGAGGLTATYVVMPMRFDSEPGDSKKDKADAQTTVPGVDMSKPKPEAAPTADAPVDDSDDEHDGDED